MERGLDDNLFGGNVPEAPSLETTSLETTSDVETEKAVLSLCMRKKEALNDIIGKKIDKDDFSDPRNATIFEAITKLYIDNDKVDKFTVGEKLERMGKLNAAGGNEYVFGVASTTAVQSNADSYINIIRDKSSRRKLIKMLEELQKKAKSSKNSVNDVVDLSVGQLTRMRDNPEGIGFEQLAAIVTRNINEIHSIMLGKKSASGIKSGFRHLDYMLGGFRPGTLNIIAARPGMGKTALVLNIATNIGLFRHENVNIFSLEMSKSEIGNRILASKAKVTTKQLQRATGISKEDEDELVVLCKELSETPIYIDDNSSVNPVSMMATCKDLKAKGQLGIIIVDYLQLMSMPGRGNNSSRQQEISDISRSLKVMAKDLEVPVIALSQLSRGSERREDHTPMLSDLRDSGAIEQDADAVIFIDREDYYNKDAEKNESRIQNAKLIIAKNRHGETGTIPIKWWGEKTLFFEEDAAYDPKDPRSTGQQAPSQGKGSSFTRTVSADSSSSNYTFEGSEPEPVPPVTDGYDGGYADGYGNEYEGGDFADGSDYDPDEAFSNPENDMLFEGSNSDFPEGF